jgi:hypothetical protein
MWRTDRIIEVRALFKIYCFCLIKQKRIVAQGTSIFRIIISQSMTVKLYYWSNQWSN